jgi:hypothetical protein
MTDLHETLVTALRELLVTHGPDARAMLDGSAPFDLDVVGPALAAVGLLRPGAVGAQAELAAALREAAPRSAALRSALARANPPSSDAWLEEDGLRDLVAAAGVAAVVPVPPSWSRALEGAEALAWAFPEASSGRAGGAALWLDALGLADAHPATPLLRAIAEAEPGAAEVPRQVGLRALTRAARALFGASPLRGWAGTVQGYAELSEARLAAADDDSARVVPVYEDADEDEQVVLLTGEVDALAWAGPGPAPAAVVAGGVLGPPEVADGLVRWPILAMPDGPTEVIFQFEGRVLRVPLG